MTAVLILSASVPTQAQKTKITFEVFANEFDPQTGITRAVPIKKASVKLEDPSADGTVLVDGKTDDKGVVTLELDAKFAEVLLRVSADGKHGRYLRYPTTLKKYTIHLDVVDERPVKATTSECYTVVYDWVYVQYRRRRFGYQQVARTVRVPCATTATAMDMRPTPDPRFGGACPVTANPRQVSGVR
jgi:hypothetical protein